MLYTRSLRGKLPVLEESLQAQQICPLEQERRKNARKGKAEERYNARAADLPQLHVGQQVQVQDPVSKKWDKVGVIDAVGLKRSYRVELEGGAHYWRNRLFIRPYHGGGSRDETMGDRPSSEPKPPLESSGGRRKERVRFDVPEAQEAQHAPPRRSSRSQKRPERLGVHQP